MLGRSLNYIEDPAYVVERNLAMEEVTHRVDEDSPRRFPSDRNFERVGVKCEAKARAACARITVPFVLLHSHGLQPFGECQGVAVITAGRGSIAPRRGVPRRIGPFDRT